MKIEFQVMTEHQPLLVKWLAPLSGEQKFALYELWQASGAIANLEPEDQVQADPYKAVLIEAAKQWLFTLHTVWGVKFNVGKDGWEDWIKPLAQPSLSLMEVDDSLLGLVREQLHLLLWRHPRTKAKVRRMTKAAFMESDLLEDVDVFDVPAVIDALTPDYSSLDAEHELQENLKNVLNRLAHFTSKPVHTWASAVGVTLPSNASSAGPYLTGSLLVEQGRTLLLDQITNDNTGQVGAYMGMFNGTAVEESPVILSHAKQIAREHFLQRSQKGTESIDPRLKQIYLPVQDSRYRSITPLVSMGLSAYLHSHWLAYDVLPADQNADSSSTVAAENPAKKDVDKPERVSYADIVRFGFSSKAIENFTAIRTIQNIYTQEVIKDFPCRALLFKVPSRDEARSRLAGVCHKGFRLRLPKWLQKKLMEAYTQAAEAVIGVSTVHALEQEQEIHQPTVRWLANLVSELREHCGDALDEMDETERAKWLEDIVERSVVEQFLLAGLNQQTANSVSAAELGDALARQLYQHLEQLKNSDGATLGLSQMDRQRFMRWAPEIIARAFVAY